MFVLGHLVSAGGGSLVPMCPPESACLMHPALQTPFEYRAIVNATALQQFVELGIQAEQQFLAGQQAQSSYL